MKNNNSQFEPLPEKSKQKTSLETKGVSFYKKLLFIAMPSGVIYVLFFQSELIPESSVAYGGVANLFGRILFLWLVSVLYKREYREKTLPKPSTFGIAVFPPAVFFWK